MKKLNHGQLTVVVGRTQSGKTWSVRQAVKSEPRLLVWDIEGVWASSSGIRRCATRKDLLKAIRVAGTGALRLAYVSADRADFNFWADCGYWWGRVGAAAGVRTVAVAEEIAFVTSPGKAPPGWHRLIAQGLKWGIDIWALTQRPAESDKTCLGNATLLRCFDLTREEDRRYMARQLDCPPERIGALPTYSYLQRNMITKELKVCRSPR